MINRALHLKQESCAVARNPRDAVAVLAVRRRHSLYKFKSGQASKAGLQSSKHNRRKTEFNAKWPFKVMCFGVSGKAIRDLVIL